MLRWLLVVSFALTAFGVASSRAEAQYCQADYQCGGGYACVNGACVQAQVQAQPVYGQPAYGQPAYAQPVYGQQPQPQYSERPLWGLIGPGIGLLAGGYVANVFVSLVGAAILGFSNSIAGTSYAASDFFYWGLVPVVGPWVQMAVINGDEGWMPWLLVTGLLQTAGLAMIILGAVLRERVVAVADLGEGRQLSFTPVIGPDTAMLGATLTF